MPTESQKKTLNYAWLHQPPPIHRINLSLPPSERYVELARLYRDQMRSLRCMFDELLLALSPKIPVKFVHFLARTFLRKLSTSEETEELRGISRVTGIDLYFLICFNTVLDLLMGCTSGGVRTIHGSYTKMLHFRTLDWGMDKLRCLTVQLEYIRDEDPEKVLATSITYVGFIGVLTGVKKDLSLSLNFRPVHDTTKDFSFYLNHLLVLLGQRRSISSLLRQCLIPASQDSKAKDSSPALATLDDIVKNFPSQPSTAAYLIASDGEKTVTLEKDLRTAVIRSDPNFIVVTNNDQEPDSMPSKGAAKSEPRGNGRLALISEEEMSLEELIEDSKVRHACMQDKWNLKMERNKQARSSSAQAKGSPAREVSDRELGGRSSLRLRQKAAERQEKAALERETLSRDPETSEMAITPQEARQWLTTYPVLNEDTHYATLMDPSEGKLFWVSQYGSGQVVDNN